MNKSTIENLSARVERYLGALDQIPKVDTASMDWDQFVQHEEMMARLAEDPENIVFEEGLQFVDVSAALVAWLKLPEQEATRERLGQMIDEALPKAE